MILINANHAVDFLPEEHKEVNSTRVEASGRAARAKFETTLDTLPSPVLRITYGPKLGQCGRCHTR